jgi:hypothetical protein
MIIQRKGDDLPYLFHPHPDRSTELTAEAPPSKGRSFIFPPLVGGIKGGG